MIYPCMNCNKRHVGCHSSCDEYKRCSEEHRAINGKLQQDKENDRVIIEVRDKKFKSLGYK